MKNTNVLDGLWRRPKFYFELTKPRISVLCVLMSLGGVALAPQPLNWVKLFLLSLSVFFSVGSANALNMAMEYKTDALMSRTKNRPIASGRISPREAGVFGVLLGLISTLLLAAFVNPLTASLSLWAIIVYVLVYTPLKYLSPTALIIGAFPGAMPPLLGWTAAQNAINLPGLVLFGILFFWQIPHFVAISFLNSSDYKSAGIKTITLEQGPLYAKIEATLFSATLLIVSVVLFQIGSAGVIYLGFACILGLIFLLTVIKGFFNINQNIWCKQVFFGSLAYLPLLTLGLAVDRWLQ